MDDTYKAAIMTAIAILLTAGMGIRLGQWPSPFPRRTVQRGPSSNRRTLRTTVDVVPPPGRYPQQPSVGRDDSRDNLPRPIRLLHSVDSVGSLRPPPPAYGVHHLDLPYDGVPYGYVHVNLGSSAGDAVGVVPGPFPPPYLAEHDGGHQAPQ